MLSNPTSRQVKSVGTAFDLVHQLQALGGASLTDLTEETDLAKSTVHNYLSTLEAMGYVVNEDGIYRLGLRFLTHGVAAKGALGIQNPIRELLPSIAREVLYPTWWVSEEYGRGIFLEKGTVEEGEEIYGRVGKRSYLHTHALGKAILARTSDQYVERIIEHYGLPQQTAKTTTDADALFEEIEEIRHQGFAVDSGEAALGIISVGVSFRDPADRVHAIGVFGSSREFTSNRATDIGTTLTESVRSLENQLGTRGD